MMYRRQRDAETMKDVMNVDRMYLGILGFSMTSRAEVVVCKGGAIVFTAMLYRTNLKSMPICPDRNHHP